jgi:hypothetical protein
MLPHEVTVYVYWLQIYDREFASVLPTIIGLYTIGILMVQLFGNMELGAEGSSDITAVIMCMHLAFSLFVMSRTVSWFGRDERIRFRELSSGVDLIGLFTGKIFGNIGDCLCLPLAFVCGSFPFSRARSSFAQYWATFVLLYLAITGIAHFVTSMFDVSSSLRTAYSVLILFCTYCIKAKHANVVGTGIVVVFWSFGGLNPTVDEIEASLAGFGLFVNAISPFKWSFQRQVPLYRSVTVNM